MVLLSEFEVTLFDVRGSGISVDTEGLIEVFVASIAAATSKRPRLRAQ